MNQGDPIYELAQGWTWKPYRLVSEEWLATFAHLIHELEQDHVYLFNNTDIETMIKHLKDTA